jgi:hypothetical protein
VNQAVAEANDLRPRDLRMLRAFHG